MDRSPRCPYEECEVPHHVEAGALVDRRASKGEAFVATTAPTTPQVERSSGATHGQRPEEGRSPWPHHPRRQVVHRQRAPRLRPASPLTMTRLRSKASTRATCW